MPDTSSGGLPTIDKSDVKNASHRGKSLPSSCVTEYLNLPGPVILNVSLDIKFITRLLCINWISDN